MIDIIIPAYNSHKTIIKTLYSIIIQKKVDDINVLIVDDCSDENFDEICTFFSKYLNIKTLRLKENKGPGVARQYGLENTHGKYIVFLDSDDELFSENSISELYDEIIIEDYDIAFAKMYQEQYDIVSYHEECLHGKMYKRSFIEKNNINFNTLSYHEDNAFNKLCLCSTDKIIYVDKIVYKYNHRESSITNTTSGIDSMNSFIESMTWLYQRIENLEKINYGYASKTIASILHYCYFSYISFPQTYEYITNELSFLKKKYKEYINYITPEDEFLIYNSFQINHIPEISFNEFLNKIK